jgi:uroporphyrinogen decarboxylase
VTITMQRGQMTPRERVAAARRGQPVDRMPVSVWRHFPVTDMTAEGLAEATVDFQRRLDWDLVKLMPPGVYSIIDYGVVTDWIPNANGVRTPRGLRVTRSDQWSELPRLDARSGFLGQQNRALQLTLQQLGTEVPALQTVFSPLTTARKLAGDAVFEHMRADPFVFESAFQAIVEATTDFVQDAVEMGAGIFYATQCATGSTLTDTELVAWEVEPARRILAQAVRASAPIIVHIHGEAPRLNAFRLLGADGVNWHDRTARPALAAARAEMPDTLLVGGLDGVGTLSGGTPAAITTEVREAIAATAGRGLLLAPGCVIPIATPEEQLDALREAVAQAPMPSLA